MILIFKLVLLVFMATIWIRFSNNPGNEMLNTNPTFEEDIP